MNILCWLQKLGNKYRWLSFVLSILFVGLALFQVSINGILGYVLFALLIILGILTVITFNTKPKEKYK